MGFNVPRRCKPRRRCKTCCVKPRHSEPTMQPESKVPLPPTDPVQPIKAACLKREDLLQQGRIVNEMQRTSNSSDQITNEYNYQMEILRSNFEKYNNQKPGITCMNECYSEEEFAKWDKDISNMRPDKQAEEKSLRDDAYALYKVQTPGIHCILVASLPACTSIPLFNWDENDKDCPKEYRDNYLMAYDCIKLPFYLDWYNRIILMPQGKERQTEYEKYLAHARSYSEKAGACIEKYRVPCNPL